MKWLSMQPFFIIKMIIKSGLEVSRCRVAVLGVTFKENCPDIKTQGRRSNSRVKGLGY